MIYITVASRGQLYTANGDFYEAERVKKEFKS